jgi:hypothetical protein
MMHDMMNMMGGMGWLMGLVWVLLVLVLVLGIAALVKYVFFKDEPDPSRRVPPGQNRRSIMSRIQSIAMVILALVVLPY